MEIFTDVLARNRDINRPFLLGRDRAVSLADIRDISIDLSAVSPGDVVALVGDIDAQSIGALLALVEKNAVIMPLTKANSTQHQYFFDAGLANAVFENGKITRLGAPRQHPLLVELREKRLPGLILFTSGSTGKPKAILHDFSHFLLRYQTPRTPLTTLNFLLFDHIGGLNTLFHTLYNGGKIIIPSGRDPASVTADIQKYDIDLLPTTPTFLRLWGLHGIPANLPSLKLISYGTEKMDRHTLCMVANALPNVDIRQTYGMSELGIMRVRTRQRDDLWIQVGGEGVETRVVDNELFIRAEHRMLGYLNAPSPFTEDGWYATGDLVEVDGDWLAITGRKDGIINVGGLKVFPAEVEQAALGFPGVKFAKAVAGKNPVTGMHVELLCEAAGALDIPALKKHLAASLPPHARPRRIRLGKIEVSHRFKRL